MSNNSFETEAKQFFSKPKNVGCLTLVVILVIITIVGSLGDGSSSHPRIGEYGTITTETFGCIDKSTMDEVGKSSVARDEMGILQLMYEGRVEVLQAGTRVKVIESSWTSMRVRTQQGHALWVTASHVRK